MYKQYKIFRALLSLDKTVKKNCTQVKEVKWFVLQKNV